MTWTLIVSLVVVSHAGGRGEECDFTGFGEDCTSTAMGRHGMLQVSRARETISVGDGNGNGDMASLLAMKSQLKEKLDSKTGMPPEEQVFLTDFVTFLTNTSLVAINATHETSQNQIYASADQFLKCAEELIINQRTGMWYHHLDDVSLKEVHHLQCRTEEATFWPKPNQTCHQNLDVDFVTPLDPPDTNFPGKENWATSMMTQWLQDFHNWHCVGNPLKKDKLHDLGMKCKSDALAAKNKRIECKHKQHSFEHAFCSLRKTVITICETYNDCYGQALAEFNALVQDNQQEMSFTRTEYQVIQTVICYIRLMFSSQSFDDIKQEDKEACEQPYPDDFLDLEVPSLEPPMPEPCGTEAVMPIHPAPCEAAFIDKYYVAKLNATTPAAVCLPCHFDQV